MRIPPKPQFTRKTVLAAIDLIAGHPAMYTHAAFDGFILELGAESAVPIGKNSGTIAEKANALKMYLIAHPSAQTPDSEFTVDIVVRKAASLPNSLDSEKLVRALARDTFTINAEGTIRRMLPEIADIPAANNEVQAFLEDLGLTVAKGHLEHAFDLRGRGKWEPANGELRKVLENIFDEAAAMLDPNRAAVTPKGNARRELLTKLNPPFLIEALGEWGDGGKNLVNGIFKRLHTGAHPGMSEDEDCTFRLHLVLVVGRLFLRRLKSRVQSGC